MGKRITKTSKGFKWEVCSPCGLILRSGICASEEQAQRQAGRHLKIFWR